MYFDSVWNWKFTSFFQFQTENVQTKIGENENDLDIDNTYFIYTSNHGFHFGTACLIGDLYLIAMFAWPV